jgi:hypothetical protein
MSFKVVRIGGNVVAFGPNADSYEPAGDFSIESDEPAIYVDPKVAIRAEIESLERAALLPRATREFMLLAMEAQAPAEVLALNPGYAAVKAFDTQIAALRAQL